MEGVRNVAKTFDTKRLFGLVDLVMPRTGLLDGRRLEEFVRANVSEQLIEDLPIPYSAVATDISTALEVILDSGDVAQAVRASVSVPGLFTPVQVDDMTLVDGGLLNPVPPQSRGKWAPTTL